MLKFIARLSYFPGTAGVPPAFLSSGPEPRAGGTPAVPGHPIQTRSVLRSSRSMRSNAAAGIVAVLLTSRASAHDFWIEPSNFRPAVGERVAAALRVGQKLAGDPLPRIPMLIDRFVLKGEKESAFIGRPG